VTPERWQQVSTLFQRALETDPSDRARMLREATLDDPDLRREVESLLETHQHADTFLEEPAWGIAARLILDEDSLVGADGALPRARGDRARRHGRRLRRRGPALGRTVALKALPPEWAADPRRRERLRREARAAAALSHPAIATIFALEEIDGGLYLVSELVRGRTLREELADGPLASERVVPTLCDLAAAMTAAHAQGIVHRDLKPENIIRRDRRPDQDPGLRPGAHRRARRAIARTAPDRGRAAARHARLHGAGTGRRVSKPTSAATSSRSA
jgi:hypothetical protein